MNDYGTFGGKYSHLIVLADRTGTSSHLRRVNPPSFLPHFLFQPRRERESPGYLPETGATYSHRHLTRHIGTTANLEKLAGKYEAVQLNKMRKTC
jgi:hypothetical protein